MVLTLNNAPALQGGKEGAGKWEGGEGVPVTYHCSQPKPC